MARGKEPERPPILKPTTPTPSVMPAMPVPPAMRVSESNSMVAEPKAEKEACSGCKYWIPFSPGAGHCTRYPPVLIHNPNAAAVGDAGSWSFPSIAGSACCGEWVTRGGVLPPTQTAAAYDQGAFA